MVHLAVAEQVEDVAVAQVPLQEPAEHFLQGQFPLAPTGEHVLEVSQADDHLLEDGFDHLLQLLEGDLHPEALVPEQGLVAVAQHLADAAFDHVYGDVFLVVVLGIFLAVQQRDGRQLLARFQGKGLLWGEWGVGGGV